MGLIQACDLPCGEFLSFSGIFFGPTVRVRNSLSGSNNLPLQIRSQDRAQHNDIHRVCLVSGLSCLELVYTFYDMGHSQCQ